MEWACASVEQEFTACVREADIAGCEEWQQAKSLADSVGGLAHKATPVPCPKAHFGLCRTRDEAILQDALALNLHLCNITLSLPVEKRWSQVFYFRGLRHCLVARLQHGLCARPMTLAFNPLKALDGPAPLDECGLYVRSQLTWPRSFVGMSKPSTYGEKKTRAC